MIVIGVYVLAIDIVSRLLVIVIVYRTLSNPIEPNVADCYLQFYLFEEE